MPAPAAAKGCCTPVHPPLCLRPCPCACSFPARSTLVKFGARALLTSCSLACPQPGTCLTVCAIVNFYSHSLAALARSISISLACMLLKVRHSALIITDLALIHSIINPLAPHYSCCEAAVAPLAFTYISWSLKYMAAESQTKVVKLSDWRCDQNLLLCYCSGNQLPLVNI